MQISNGPVSVRRWTITTGCWLAISMTVPSASAGQDPDALAPHPPEELFDTATTCMACHNGLTIQSGEDVSIGSDWRASMMANAARDPYWQAAVRREVMDHPEAQAVIEDTCATCHMPMARFEAASAGGTGQVLAHLPIGTGDTRAERLAADGVSCTACHQITDANLGRTDSFTGGFVIDTAEPNGERQIFGPFDIDEGRTRIMQSATGFQPTEATHIQQSEVCATCHTLYTHALDLDGAESGPLPEQVPYLEWRHSAYNGDESCQSCHMPVVEEETAIASVLGEQREGVSRHVFRGGNFFMLRMLNRYRADLGVQALPQELETAARRTIDHLQTNAATVAVERLDRSGGRLRFDVAVENLAGHKLPTAYPSRRAWLHVTVMDAAGEVVFESGAFEASGAIRGNDNDVRPDAFEPHYAEISSPDQVQVYESVLVDEHGTTTTGLLTGVRYVKDNRLLPRGFDKTTAEPDIAVHGGAAPDEDFAGGSDRVRYVTDVSNATGPLRVEAELWFQPIGFRWARTLADYDAFETTRFVGYYNAMAASSAVVLASAGASLP